MNRGRIPISAPDDLNAIQQRLAYYGDDAVLERTIVETLARLPDDVRVFALDQCCFLSVGGANHGMVLPGRIGRQEADYTDVGPGESLDGDPWLVLLSESLPPRDAHGIVAHEIAHAWLGHDRLSLDVSPECEIDTANLTGRWGFTGLGANPEHCIKPYGGPANQGS